MAELAGRTHVKVEVAARHSLMPATYCRYAFPHGLWCQGPVAADDAKQASEERKTS